MSEAIPAISVSEWWNRMLVNGQRAPLLDLRPLSSHRTRRLCRPSRYGPVIVHIPFESLSSRSFELPPRSKAFVILVPERSDSLQQALSFLLAGTKQMPWTILGTIDGSDDSTWREADDLGLLCKETDDHFPLDRLWEPDSMVAKILMPILCRQATQNERYIEIWDLGAGAGRDTSFLAEQLRKASVRVFAVDQRYRTPTELDVIESFWKRRQVDRLTHAIPLNLNNTSHVLDTIHSHGGRDDGVLCLYCVRFWNRTLVEAIATDPRFGPGSIFAISQFSKAYEGQEWSFPHPKAKHVLERQEVRDIFTEIKGWSILHDEIEGDNDYGRTLLHFVARRTSLATTERSEQQTL